MAKDIVILGNGFDLDLGLKSSYADFARSTQWSELMNSNNHSLDGTWLLGFLKSKYEIEKWIDIESALLEYAVDKTKKEDYSHVKEDELDFLALCQALKNYLLEQQTNFTPTRNSVASIYLKFLACLSSQTALYTFNYTQLNVLAGKFNLDMGYDAEHIHGSLSDEGNIILGVETERPIADPYAFLYKTQNRQYRHTNILSDLRDRDEYIFFGHSLNGMDYAYFKSVFIRLSGSNLKTPRLTIITKDEDAENQFKNFLRKEFVSLQGLYSNSMPVFILTDKVYEKDETELQKVASLMERAKVM